MRLAVVKVIRHAELIGSLILLWTIEHITGFITCISCYSGVSVSSLLQEKCAPLYIRALYRGTRDILLPVAAYAHEYMTLAALLQLMPPPPPPHIHMYRLQNTAVTNMTFHCCSHLGSTSFQWTEAATFAFGTPELQVSQAPSGSTLSHVTLRHLTYRYCMMGGTSIT